MSSQTTRVRRATTRRPSLPTPLAFGLDDAAQMLGIGRTKLRELIASGKLPSFQVGRRRLVSEADLREFVEAQQRRDLKRVS
ncbi:MAG: helix-turn-helix domain-containing protein [Actinobacteria bacterium]|uniref:Unannotated protein n=1 Tax=freshwater metagenome TaxID=449393 RepID=A0A6J6FF93_9ZZZZ|nr:helix-turn-helix domain-containing protein [Actinomycetota bacterium]